MGATLEDPKLVAARLMSEVRDGSKVIGNFQGRDCGVVDLQKVTPETLLAGFDEVARARANFVPEMQRQVGLLDPFFVAAAEKLLRSHPEEEPEDVYFLLGSVIDASNQAKVLLREPELLARWNAEPDLESRRFLGQGMDLRSIDNRSIAIEMADAYIKSLAN